MEAMHAKEWEPCHGTWSHTRYPGMQIAKQNAVGKHICSPIVRIFADDLGCHVLGSAAERVLVDQLISGGQPLSASAHV